MMKHRILGQSIFLGLIGLMLAACVSPQQTQKEAESVRARARAHTDLGAAYYQQNQLDVALEEFTLASQIDPNFGFAFNGLGLVNAALGQDEIANQHFKRAIEIEPTNSESHNNYGNFLCSKKRYDESIKEFLTAVKNPLYSTPASAYTNAGICSIRKKDLKNAEIYFSNALQIEPLSKVAAYQLASLQYQRNDPKAAYATLQNLLMSDANAEILGLAVQITKSLTMKDLENQYAIQLMRQFPNSEQAKRLKSDVK